MLATPESTAGLTAGWAFEDARADWAIRRVYHSNPSDFAWTAAAEQDTIPSAVTPTETNRLPRREPLAPDQSPAPRAPGFWRRHAAWLAAALASAWAMAVLAAPALATWPASGPAGLHVSAAVYLTGGVVCHQRAARSFRAAGGQLPVCARCTALYLSGAAGLALTPLGLRLLRRRAAVRFGPLDGWQMVLAAAALPTLATLVLEWSGIWSGSNTVRALAAVPLGWAIGTMLGDSLRFRSKL